MPSGRSPNSLFSRKLRLEARTQEVQFLSHRPENQGLVQLNISLDTFQSQLSGSLLVR